mgnify:CR=1 FL=1
MIQVWDHINCRPTFWQPKGRFQHRAYYDPERRQVALVQVCKKTQAASQVTFWSLTGTETFAEFRREWQDESAPGEWKRRAPITEAHVGLMAAGQKYSVAVWDMPSPQFARALAGRGLKQPNGMGLLGHYSAGERQPWCRCHCEDPRCNSRGHWEEPFYASHGSPLVDWLVQQHEDN